MNGEKRHDRRYRLLLVAILAVLYGLCQNGQWIPSGGDDALYLSIARDLASGKAGLLHETPPTLVPLGWPYLLSLLMRISPSFLLLNAAVMVFCLAAVSLWYGILRRFTSPLRAFITMLVVGILFEWHRFSFTHYAEALFYLLVAAAILLALHISERRPALWRIPLLLVLCLLAVMVRSAGLALVLLPAGALASGQLWPRSKRCWIAFAVLFAATAATHVVVRRAMSENIRHVSAQAGNEARKSETQLELRRDRAIVTGISPSKRYLLRLRSAGTWMSRLLWPPAGSLHRVPAAAAAVNLLGWALIVLFALRLPAAIKRREWLWGAAFLLCGLFVVIWGRPVPRYLAPMAPLIVLGIWDGLDKLLAADRHPGRRAVSNAVAGVLLGSIIACNGAILAVAAAVARSSDFVTRCQAGEHAELIGVAKALRTMQHGALAVAARYEDPNRQGQSDFGPRMVKMLTGEEVLLPPRELRGREELLAWARAAKVRYLLTRPPGKKVTRAWHFRLGESEGLPFYELLEVTDDGARAVQLPSVTEGVRRVPGL